MASVKSPELGSVGALGWQVHPRVGSSFQHGDDGRSSQQDGESDGKLNRVNPSKERAEEDHGEDEGDAGSEDSMDWALQWKQQREYEKQHKQLREEHNQLLLDANKILDSSSDEEDEGGGTSDRGGSNGYARNIEENHAVSPRRASPRVGGGDKEPNTSALSFIERSHAFMNARDTKVTELAKKLQVEAMESHTFQPKVNQNATSPVGAPRDFAKRTRLHLEQRNEKIERRAFQLQREEAARMQSKPRLVSKQPQFDKTPVVDRLYAAGERSKQKRDALRKSLEEHDEVSGQRLFHPKFDTAARSPVSHSPKVTKLYGETNGSAQPRLYREAQARQKRAEDRRRDADQALAKAVADATRANTKSTQYIRERTERDLETAYKLFLGRFADSVTLPGDDGLMYPHVYASTLHLIRSKHLRVQSGSENDEHNSAFVAQVVWHQLKGQNYSPNARAVVLDEDSWSRFIEKMNFGFGSTGAPRQRGEHGELNNIIPMSTLGIPPPDPAPALGDIVSVISTDTLRNRRSAPPAPPPPDNGSPNWRFPEFPIEMEAVVENTGGVSTALVVPRTLSSDARRAVCSAFLAACVRWVDQIRAQSTGTLGAMAAAKKRETQSCTFSPELKAKAKSSDYEAKARRRRQQQQQQQRRQVVDDQQKRSEAPTDATPSGLETELVPSSAAGTRRPGTKQNRIDMMLQKHHEAQARLELAKAKEKEDEQKSLTFKPVVKGFSYRPSGGAGPQSAAASNSRRGDTMASKVKRSGPAHLRLYKQANSNSAFLQAERRKLKEKEVEGCTFQPDRVTKKSYKSKPPPPPANVPKKTTAAISEHIERIKAAKDRKDKQKLIESQANVYSEETYQKSQMNKEIVPFELATDRRQEDREKNTPALYMDVNMGKGKSGRIGIAPGDRASALAEKFAAVHSLRQSEAVEKLAGLIQATAERNGVRLVR